MTRQELPALLAAVIPCLDVSAGSCTDPVGIPGLTATADPVAVVAHYAGHGAARVFVDIIDSWDEADLAVKVVEDLAGTGVELIVSLGHGRVPSVDAAGRLLAAGAAALSVSTGVVTDPDTVAGVVDTFGGHRVVGTVNAREDRARGGWTVYVDDGHTPTGIPVAEFGRTLAGLGVGTVLANSVDREGTGRGYDQELVRTLADATGLPVIASGGSRSVDHLWEGITGGGATYVLANKMLHSGAVSLEDIRRSRAPRYR